MKDSLSKINKVFENRIRLAIMSLLMAMTVALIVLLFPKPLVPEQEEQEYEA